MNQEVLVEVLATLLALRDLAQEAHWTAEGANFYGDHLLYERLYDKLDKPIDKLAEMLVARFGPTAVGVAVRSRSLELLASREDLADAQRLLLLEAHLLDAIREALPPFEADPRGLGVADFLVGLAGDREEAKYLLVRRLGARANPRSRSKRSRGQARLAHVPRGRLEHVLRKNGHYGEIFAVVDVTDGSIPVTACWIEDVASGQLRRVNATLMTAHDRVELRVGPLQSWSAAKTNPRRLL